MTTTLTLPLLAPDPVAFAPYGHFVTPPATPGERRFYSEVLDKRPAGAAPVLHTNHVLPQTLPLDATRIERHPHAAQCFIPLDVARYVVMVMPSAADGSPLPEQALALLMPGTMGVVYNPGVWHLGATVLDHAGSFTVLMWRGGPQADDQFLTIPPVTLQAPS
jgi:ureidoglycolate lyase